MLSSISWSQYFIGLLLATLVYYALIWLFILKGRVSFFPIAKIGSPSQAEDGPDEIISTAQHVIDELRPMIRRDVSQNELLFGLQQKLKLYKTWEEPGFRETINAFILGAFQTTCSIRLGEDEIRELWK